MNDFKPTNAVVYNTHEEAVAALPKTGKGDDMREKARAHRQAAQDSFDRCDTDGFLSQWASGISARLADLKADLANTDGLTVIDVLVDIATDAVIGVKTVRGNYGEAFPVQRNGKTEWISACLVKEASYAKKGVRRAYMHCPAYADTVGGGRGLAGCASVSTAIIPLRSVLERQLGLNAEWHRKSA